MKIVTIKVTSEDEKDTSATSVVHEKDRGAGYLRIDSKDIVTNKDKAQEFKLRQGERLVIEAYPAEAVAYDRDQGAAFKTASQENPERVDKPTNKPTSEEEKTIKQEQARAEASAKSQGLPAPQVGVATQVGVAPKGAPFPQDATTRDVPASQPKAPEGGKVVPSTQHDNNPGLVSSRDVKK